MENERSITEKIKKVEVRRRPWAATLIIILGTALLLISMFLSFPLGIAKTSFADVWKVMIDYDSSVQYQAIIMEKRIPRAVGAVLVGMGFAIAGAIMQGMTRNPLADSSILGINAGAVFGLALCLALWPDSTYAVKVALAFGGAATASFMVFGISSMNAGGATPLRLVLAGASIAALFTALSEGISLYFGLSQDIAYWFSGGIVQTGWNELRTIAPIVIIAIIASMFIGRSITLLSLGDEIATSLGQNIYLVKAIAVMLVLILAGTSVAVVGAVSFVGLIVPHLVRYMVGVDYRLIIPCSAVVGGLLVLYADIAARTINTPAETPIGAIIALFGVPFFLYLARKERRIL
jgi:iron complex transport system permease protein